MANNITKEDLAALVVDRPEERGPFDIIGDIHGCRAELEELLVKLGYAQRDGCYRHSAGRRVIFLGDLINRGPDSPGVIRLVAAMVNRGQALNVRGNHCHYVYGYFKGYGGIDFQRHRPWLAAMSEAERADLGELYCRLIESAPPYMLLDEGRLAVAHAGVEEPMLGRLDRRIFDFCLYGELTSGLTYAGYPARRDWAATYQGQPFIAYGHTPTQALEPEIRFNTVNLDQGCCFGGRLTGLRWPELTFEQVNQIKPLD